MTAIVIKERTEVRAFPSNTLREVVVSEEGKKLTIHRSGNLDSLWYRAEHLAPDETIQGVWKKLVEAM